METDAENLASTEQPANPQPARRIVKFSQPRVVSDKYIAGGIVAAGIEIIEVQPENNTFVFSLVDDLGRRIGDRVLGAPSIGPITDGAGPAAEEKALSDIWAEVDKR